MQLRISIILATLALAAVAIASPASSASTTHGYTCKYRIALASAVVDGYDNSNFFCRSFNSGLNAQRFYGPTHGGLVCRYAYRLGDVRVSIYTSNSRIGRAYCQLIGNVKGFVRMR